MYPTGHLRDPIGCEIGHEVGRLVALAPVPEAWSLVGWVQRVKQQRGNSCVNSSFSSALSLLGAKAGRPIDPSDLATYAIARELQFPGEKLLPDLGCFPHLAIEAIQEFGVVARERWPDGSPIESTTPHDVKEAGQLAIVGGVYRVYETGADRLYRVRQAISQGHPVAFGMQVDEAYERYAGGVYRSVRGAHLGGHMQLLVGYAPDTFRVLNSWGTSWGDGGFAWVHDDIIVDEAFDLTIFTLSPDEVV